VKVALDVPGDVARWVSAVAAEGGMDPGACAVSILAAVMADDLAAHGGGAP
jgi:hypothetical protein